MTVLLIIQMRQKEDLQRENQKLKLELERSSLTPKRNHTPVGASVDEVENHLFNFSKEIHPFVL